VNEGKESGIWGWSRWCEEGRIGKDGLQVICTLFLQTNQRTTKNIRDLSSLTYSDLKTRNHGGQKFIGRKSCKTTMKTEQE